MHRPHSSSFALILSKKIKIRTVLTANGLPLTRRTTIEKKLQKTGAGAIINTTGSRLIFPKGLSNKYCADFLDVNVTCRHGEKCNFVHAVFPSGFTTEDVKIMEEHVNKTNGLKFKHYNNKVS